MGDEPEGADASEESEAWAEARDAMTMHEVWTPERLRDEINRLRRLVDEDRCPRDRDTIAATIAGLSAARSDINKRSKTIAAWWPDACRSFIATTFTALVVMLSIAMKDTVRNPGAYTYALVALSMLFALSVIATAWTSSVIRHQVEDAHTVSEYDSFIAMLRGYRNDSRQFERMPNGRYAGVLGSDDDMKELHDIRRGILDLGTYPLADKIMLIQAIDARLGEFAGKPKSDKFKLMLGIVERGLNNYRPEPMSVQLTEHLRVESAPIVRAEDDEEAPRAADSPSERKA